MRARRSIEHCCGYARPIVQRHVREIDANLPLFQGLRSILFGIEPTDPLTLVGVGVSLMLVALVAVTVPALRAMRIDPVTALRQQ